MKYLIIVLLFAVSCNNSSNKKPATPKGELAFLLQYNGRMPSDVGFLSNHIMERRLANLMKENYEPFIQTIAAGEESLIQVDTINFVVLADFWNGKMTHHQVVVDVANDAVWIDYTQEGTLLHYADRTSLKRPEKLQ